MPQNTIYHYGNLRQELLDTVIELISKNGQEKTSLRSIAREIGVSHTAPMRRFPSKYALLAAIAKDGVSSMVASALVPEKIESESSPIEKLKVCAVSYVKWAMNHPPSSSHVIEKPRCHATC